MEWANILSIYKGKGEKSSLESDRGIFIMNIFRSIMMKLIYNEEYETIDSNMSDSNIGARKRKNIRNHIFIINGVINDTIRNKKNCVDIQILDYRQCFDSMWLEECVNDLYESGVTGPNLAVIYEANKTNKVAVKTPSGLTRRENINQIVMQGEVLGPIECSVTIDTFGKECLAEQKYLYSYKGLVAVPPLAMVDDLACISVCGLETVQMNGYINAKTNVKKLQFGEKKCHRMHIGKENPYCPDLYIDNWKVENLADVEPENDSKIDAFDGDYQIEDSDEEKYLGDLLTSNGSNEKNIKARKAKGFGIADKIESMLNDIFFGPFYIEVGLILRSSLFLNSILLNSEAWYGLSKSEIEQLEVVDNSLLRRILEAPACTPSPMLYLELGCLPIRYIIMSRRLMYLQYLLQEQEDSLLKTFFMAQMQNPVKGDWILQVRKDLEETEINDTLEDIQKMSIEEFKAKVKTSVKNSALKYLNSEKARMSKIMYISHDALELQPYLSPTVLEVSEAKLLFQLRSRMTNVKVNFRNKYSNIICPVCDVEASEDSQQHVFECIEILKNKNIVAQDNILYSHIFDKDVEKQGAALRLFKHLWSIRKSILKAQQEDENSPGDPVRTEICL